MAKSSNKGPALGDVFGGGAVDDMGDEPMELEDDDTAVDEDFDYFADQALDPELSPEERRSSLKEAIRYCIEQYGSK